MFLQPSNLSLPYPLPRRALLRLAASICFWTQTLNFELARKQWNFSKKTDWVLYKINTYMRVTPIYITSIVSSLQHGCPLVQRQAAAGRSERHAFRHLCILISNALPRGYFFPQSICFGFSYEGAGVLLHDITLQSTSLSYFTTPAACGSDPQESEALAWSAISKYYS